MRCSCTIASDPVLLCSTTYPTYLSNRHSTYFALLHLFKQTFDFIQDSVATH